MSKIYVDEIAPKTTGGNITLDTNIIAPNRPAFKVGRSETFSVFGLDNPIVFNQDEANNGTFNTGSYYDTSTGHFTAPVSGVYAFHCQLLAQELGAGDLVEGYIRIIPTGGTDTTVGYFGRLSYSDNATGEGQYLSLNGSVVLSLSSGDKVYVSWYREGSTGKLHGNSIWNYFTGYLVG